MSIDHSNQLLTERLLLKRPSQQDATRILAYRVENRVHLNPWEPARDDAFYTLQSVVNQLDRIQMQMEEGTAQYWILELRGSAKMVGDCSFTNIVRGPFQACYLGFSVAQKFEGMGLMHEALQIAISGSRSTKSRICRACWLVNFSGSLLVPFPDKSGAMKSTSAKLRRRVYSKLANAPLANRAFYLCSSGIAQPC